MPKPSDIGKVLRGFQSAGEWASHAHTLWAVLRAITTHKAPEDAPAAAKGLAGILGHADEAALWNLLNQLTEEERRAILYFMAWHFATRPNLNAWVLWWYRNDFTTFVTRMGSADGRVLATIEEVVRSRTGNRAGGTNTTTTTTREQRGRGTNNSLKFLKLCASIIMKASNIDNGCDGLLKAFRATGVPVIPENPPDVMKLLNPVLAKAKTAGVTFVTETDKLATDLEAGLTKRESGYLRRLHEWLFG